MMKEYVLIFLVALVAVVGGNLISYQILSSPSDFNELGGDVRWKASSETLIGTSANLGRLPLSAVFANSTTTDGALNQGGGTVDQLVNTEGYDQVNLDIVAKGGTATSTLFIRQMGSYDGTNFFNIATTTLDVVPTTTVAYLGPSGAQFDPGTATTTGISLPFKTHGYRYTRFIMYGEDIATDPDDAVFAWIRAVHIEPFNR